MQTLAARVHADNDVVVPNDVNREYEFPTLLPSELI